MINTIYIYFLHVGNEVPFYVGKTNNPRTRQTNHKRKKNNRNIKLEILDEVREDEWKFWECYWIEQFKQWGFKLENGNKGGGGVTKHSPQSKLKFSQSLKGRIVSDEWKRKNSLSSLLTNTSGPVYQFDKQNNFIKIWDAACLAEDYYNPGDRRKRDNIRACIRGRQKTAYGFIWKETY
jgi:hypothetical protein